MRRSAIGILAGWALWVMLIVLYLVCGEAAGALPGPLQKVAGNLTGAVGFAAWPLAMYGFFAWGEAGWWMGVWPNLIGVVLYGLLGMILVAPLLAAAVRLPPHETTDAGHDRAERPRLLLVVFFLLVVGVFAALIARRNAAYMADYRMEKSKPRQFTFEQSGTQR